MKFIDKEVNLIMWMLLLLQTEFISTSCDLNNNKRLHTIDYKICI
jgi:hypothetical protein